MIFPESRRMKKKMNQAFKTIFSLTFKTDKTLAKAERVRTRIDFVTETY